MKRFKKKNRQRNALRNGRNNSRLNNQVTEAQIFEAIDNFVEINEASIFMAAKSFYEVSGRGCINIPLIDHPDCPLEAEHLHYVTEEANMEMLLSYNLDYNINLFEEISAYEPATQAVVCFWYGRMTYTFTITDSHAAIETAWNNGSLTVH